MSIVESLIHTLDNMSKEELEKNWNEISYLNEIGPDAKDYCKYMQNIKRMKKYKVLFCDLDHTLIEPITDNIFPKGIWDMKFKFDVLDAIKKLKPEYVFIVSNQGGIEKGIIERYAFINKFEYILESIKEYCKVDVVDGTWCESNNVEYIDRKPNTGMCEQFLETYTDEYFHKEDMLMIGDASGKEGQYSDADKKTAENFGIDYLDIEDFINLYS